MIISTYVDAADEGRTLKTRFRTDPGTTPLWTGLGSIAGNSKKLTDLNQSGREIAHLLGALPRVSAVELMSFDTPKHFECLIVARLKPKASLRKLSFDIRERIRDYCGCSLGKVATGDTYNHYAKQELKKPELATASDVKFFDD